MPKSNAELLLPTAEAYSQACLELTEAAERNARAQQALEKNPLWSQYAQARQQTQELEALLQATAVYQEARAADEAMGPLREAQEEAKQAYLEARGLAEPKEETEEQ